MNGIIAWFARNGVAANLLMFAILAGGVWSVSNKIILQEYPEFPSRSISVSVSYRGSTPGEIEQAIVTRLEEALYDIEGIKEMDARASANSGSVSLEIEDGYNLSEKLDEVTNRVATIRTFPPEAERPQVSLRTRSERVITMVLSGNMSEKDLKILGEQIRDEVSNIPGITMAALKATRPYEIAIEISESTLRQYGLSFDDVTRAIRSSSVDLSAGSVKTETGRILLRTNQQAYDYKDYSAITLLTRSDGTKITLGDVAHVVDGFDETPIVARYNGKRAIAIDVFRTGMQNIIEIGDDVKEFIALKQQQLPDGIHLSYWSDDSDRIKVRLATLTDSAIFGFVLVVIILSLFLRPTLAFWVACGIPIAFAGTFLVLPYLGMSLNIMTLMAFITTLGIVVDDAIVTGENIFQHMQRGAKPLTASIKGTQEVAMPVIFGVLTTMAAFYPLFLQSGMRGSIYKNIPMIVVPVLFFSLIESKLILPAHLKHCSNLAAKTSKQNIFSRFQRFFADGLEHVILRYYRPFLNVALNHRYTATALFIGFLMVFLALVLGERIGYRSRINTPSDTSTITLRMPAGTNFEVTQEKVDIIEAVALKLKKEVNERFGTVVIQNVFATAGGQPFGESFGRRGETAGVAEEGEILIELTPSETREADYGTRELVLEMRNLVPPIPEAEELSFSFGRGGARAAMTFELIHPDISVLKAASHDLQVKLASMAGLFDITDSYERANDEFELDLKPEAEFLGVTATNLAQQVRTAFFGSEAQRIQRGRDEVRVMVRYPEKERRSLGSLQTMMIRTANGTEVPFETVAKIVPGRSLPSIQRVDRKRIIQVSADGDAETLDIETMETEILEEFLPELAATNYPGMEFGVRGFGAESRDNEREMILGIYFILAVIYALLAIPFRSYFQPIIVMSAIPFGVVGAIVGHWIMAVVFGWNGGDAIVTTTSIFGMMALAGVVVNDSLVMVHFMNDKVKEGMPLKEAVRTAGVRRFRPILLTSMTTFFGLLPLMFEDSPQASFLVPMAISLGWGIAFATAITLILIPVLVLVYDDIQQAFYRLYNIDPHAHDEGGETKAPTPA
ncbi:MAG: efflux RND transporter permease subunit [Verrucomicrobia bacterium]|nr:efflux RND transporter permease subunit [Verrucomicrobiota bacterium]MDA1069040.1 efflux RND transporter permease subunit [Verrucomicrobiota bacterium]